MGIIVISYGRSYADNLKVHFIDVRQGDAILIQYGGENYLIDSGKNLSTDKLIYYVDSVGVTHLDACLITHPDRDHYGEFEDLVESGLFTIDRFITNKTVSTNSTYITLMNLLLSENITVDSVDYEDDLNWSVTTDILSPNYNNGFSGDNDNSIVIKMSVGEVDLLLMGDSEEQNNQYLLDTYDLDIEVLKVSHHGGVTGTSEAFVTGTTPAISVICSGSNSYGHPSPVVIDLLQNAESLIYSTADDWNTWWINGGNGSDDGSEDDDVILETDGENIWVNGELVWYSYSNDNDHFENMSLNIAPNPIKHSARIHYSIVKNNHVQLDIYDIRGRLVQSVLNQYQNVGNYCVEIGVEGLRPGIYFCKLQQGDEEEIHKLVLIK
ncbi:MAG: T9SS type A sorting domain-containing protein [Candidatus Cloacimonetes bacterium]|nr:T9SS type A sorting domain-containing protein [Candidatus Cloacimonadota bacterium]